MDDRPAQPRACANADLIGADKGRWQLATPALVLDLPAFSHNLSKMASIAATRGLGLRPHAKTHKCVEIARRQMEAGAIGVSCVTLREATVMVEAGISGVLLTAPLVTPAAIARLIDLAGLAGEGGLMIVVDHPANAAALSSAAAALDHPLGVLVDFNAGYHRTGVATTADAVQLAATIAGLPNLVLRGLQAYAGNIQHIENRAARVGRAAALRAMVETIVAGAQAAGHPMPIVTGAGTGTHDIDATPFTEMQPGSYLFNDAQYAPVLIDSLSAPPFETALLVQSAVISTHAEAFVTIDAGVKAFATDGPLPLVATGADAAGTYAFFGDEYGKLFFSGARPSLGAKIEFVTPHCDPTVNLYDEIHVVDGDRLVAIWPVDARGH